MRIITAPEKIIITPREFPCFLAGGITNCSNWQDEVIKELYNYDDLDKLVVLNPRRTDFDVTNPNATNEQIEWEFNALTNRMEFFSMYFSNSKSVQPICFYELGRYIEIMRNKFDRLHIKPFTDRIVISVEDGFSRKDDVIIQCKLALGKDIVNIVNYPIEHAVQIHDKFINVFN